MKKLATPSGVVATLVAVLLLAGIVLPRGPVNTGGTEGARLTDQVTDGTTAHGTPLGSGTLTGHSGGDEDRDDDDDDDDTDDCDDDDCDKTDDDSPTGLVAHWTLDEDSGTTAEDSSGNGNDGTLVNGLTWVDGKYDEALQFDGLSGRVQVADSISIQDIFSGGGTISAWIYPNSDGERSVGRIADKEIPGRDGWSWYVYGESVGHMRLRFYQRHETSLGQWNTPAQEVTANAWNHVVIVYDSSDNANVPTMYVNGVAVAVNTLNSPVGAALSDAGNNLVIGNHANGAATFDGLIDEVRVYDRALPRGKVRNLYRFYEEG